MFRAVGSNRFQILERPLPCLSWQQFRKLGHVIGPHGEYFRALHQAILVDIVEPYPVS